MDIKYNFYSGLPLKSRAVMVSFDVYNELQYPFHRGRLPEGSDQVITELKTGEK